mgnify:CR=1 FL=1
MKVKTNRQVLAKAIKELTDLELVFLRERILQACDEVIDNEDEVRKQMERHIISPDLFIDSMKSIKEKMEFQK